MVLPASLPNSQPKVVKTSLCWVPSYVHSRHLVLWPLSHVIQPWLRQFIQSHVTTLEYIIASDIWVKWPHTTKKYLHVLLLIIPLKTNNLLLPITCIQTWWKMVLLQQSCPLCHATCLQIQKNWSIALYPHHEYHAILYSQVTYLSVHETPC